MIFKIFKDKKNVYLLELEKMEDYYKLIKQNKDKTQLIITTEIMKEIGIYFYYEFELIPKVKGFEKNNSIDILNILFKIEDCYKSKRLLEYQFDIVDDQVNTIEKISFYKKISGKLEFELYSNGVIEFQNENDIDNYKKAITEILLKWSNIE